MENIFVELGSLHPSPKCWLANCFSNVCRGWAQVERPFHFPLGSLCCGVRMFFSCASYVRLRVWDQSQRACSSVIKLGDCHSNTLNTWKDICEEVYILPRIDWMCYENHVMKNIWINELCSTKTLCALNLLKLLIASMAQNYKRWWYDLKEVI